MKRVFYRSMVLFIGIMAIAAGSWFALFADRRAETTALAQSTRNQPNVRSANENPAPVEVRVVRPTITDLRRTTTQPAHVEPFERTEIFAKASGFVASVNVDIGDAVKKGQVLVELWIPEMEHELLHKEAQLEESHATIGQARANITTAEAMVESAEAKRQKAEADIRQFEAEVAFRQSEHARFSELVKNKAVEAALLDEKLKMLGGAESSLASAQASVILSKADIKVAHARLQQAKAGLVNSEARQKIAQADLRQTETLMNYAKVRAPFTGIVTRRQIDTGAFVASAVGTRGDPLFTVERIDRFRVTADIPESESALVQIGQPVTLKVDAWKERELRGEIARMAGVLDAKTRTLRIEADFVPADSGLRAGMFGSITVTLADHLQAILLPALSIRNDAGEPFVLCVRDGVVESRPVKLGYSDGTRVEILEGIEPMDDIIVESRSQLRPGQRVNIIAAR